MRRCAKQRRSSRAPTVAMSERISGCKCAARRHGKIFAGPWPAGMLIPIRRAATQAGVRARRLGRTMVWMVFAVGGLVFAVGGLLGGRMLSNFGGKPDGA